MSIKTNIQWADSTVNPIMGCKGCELFLAPNYILGNLDQTISFHVTQWKSGDTANAFKQIIDQLTTATSEPLTTTNIYHAREHFCALVRQQHPTAESSMEKDIIKVIQQAVTCYAAKLHLNKATSAFNPTRKANPGYADTFEELRQYPGRMAKMAGAKDLYGRNDLESLWKQNLPRMIFVSDMGDAFSRTTDFNFLKTDALPAITSEAGKKHLWLWLTKRPLTMSKFAKEIGGFPENVCAMTTLTCAEPSNLRRVDQLRQVKAHCRGLSIEPLRERIPVAKLNLENIDWVIVGGESGARNNVHPFQLEWATELKEHCQEQGVAFFMKQLGRAPFQNRHPINLKHSHGGRWNEWPQKPDLRSREFPAHLHQYRQRKDTNK